MDIIIENRRKFLAALRSPDYPKGPTDVDDFGRPINKDATGFCAHGLAFTLFCPPPLSASSVVVRKSLGTTPAQMTQLQQQWNDSGLSFPEIADKIVQNWKW